MTYQICKALIDKNNKITYESSEVVGIDITSILEEDKKYGIFTPRNGKEFTFKVLDGDEEISIKQIERSVLYALRRWMIVTPLKFRRARGNEIPDFRITFTTVAEDPRKQLSANTLMYHYYPINSLTSEYRGLCVVNKAFRWTTDGEPIPIFEVDPTYPYPNTMFKTHDFDQVYTHEVGHGLGLPHAKEGGHIMSPNYGIMTEYLSEQDKTRIIAKYGKNTMSENLAKRWFNWLIRASER